MSLKMVPLHFQCLWQMLFVAATTIIPPVQAEGFTFPNSQEYEFIVGDLVNVSWDVVTPRFSLYEVCDTAVILESNATNTSSYIWNATLANYRESGCDFELEPLDADGTPNPPNLTSVLFGVSKRYSDDPAPTDYNFGGSAEQTSSSSSSSAPSSTSTSTSTSSTTTSLLDTSTTTAASSIQPTHSSEGLSAAQKVGIGVGVPLGVLSLCSILVLGMWYRRRRGRARHSDTTGQGNNTISGDDSGTMKVGKAEMEATPTTTSPLSAVFSENSSNNNNTYNNSNRISGAETLVSELSSENYRNSVLQRPISELMGTPRAEMG